MEYLSSLKVSMPEESVSQLLGVILDYDDWVHFKKFFHQYFDEGKLKDQTIKKVISSLVEKQSLELLKFVVSITMKEKNAFLNLKLTENQYKFIILALVKSHMELSSKLTSGQNAVGQTPKLLDPVQVGDTQFEVMASPQVNIDASSVRSVHESDESEDVFEVISEAMIEKIIRDIATQEKEKKSK